MPLAKDTIAKEDPPILITKTSLFDSYTDTHHKKFWRYIKSLRKNQIGVPTLCVNDVTGSAKRGLIADPHCTYLESHNLICEFSATLKFGPNIPSI